MSERIARCCAILVACALVGACASQGTVVLLPEKDGREAAVAVKQGDKEVVLSEPRAASFTLYFVEGRDEFTDESKQVVDRVLAEIAKRPVPDVLVVGHTDAVG